MLLQWHGKRLNRKRKRMDDHLTGLIAVVITIICVLIAVAIGVMVASPIGEIPPVITNASYNDKTDLQMHLFEGLIFILAVCLAIIFREV